MKSLFILLFLFLSSFFTLRAVPSINLIQDCETDTYTCKPRTWYYNPVFSDNFLRMKLPDSNWKPVKFPITVRSLHKGNETFIDYAFFTEINVTKEFLQKVSHPTIHLSYIGSAFSIYMNGKLIAKEGEFKDGQMTFYRALRHHNWPIDKLLFIEGKNFLLIRISGDPRYSGTGFYYKDGYHITEHAVAEYESRDWAGTILTFLYLAFGFYHLFLFIKRRQEVYNLTYALLSIDIFIYFICRIGIPLDYRGLDSMYIERMEYFFLFYANTLIYIFIDQLFERRISLFSKFCLFISLILSMAVLFAPAYFTEYLLLAWQISALLSVPYGFSVLIRHIKLKNKNAMALLIGLSMYIIVVIYDIANSMFLNYSIYLAKYAFFSFIVGIAVVLANRFLNLYETVEDLNENLERKVEKRTRELQHSFEEIKNLKEKQDGDYFLTTLLFKPLMSNVNKKANLKIEFLLKQKKQFQFKGKEHEIGGDICISDSIYLEEKEYAVFINGDAMGKSIQGAGGAIVLGVVFKSILSRTRLLKEMQKVSPEEWLKLAFIELQNVFESFDCSMLISIVMGLVDVETGMMYYINAEHPFICLYRDDKASFLDTELSLSKVGIPGLYNPIQVSTFTLNKDDVIIMGSDGRDDLKIEMGDVLVMNEDETLFLSMIEKGQGKLELIYKALLEVGEITDDLSLLKISYYGRSEQVVNEKDRKLLEQGIELLQKGKEEGLNILNSIEMLLPLLTQASRAIVSYLEDNNRYKDAAIKLEEYINFYPWDEKAILELSKNYLIIKDYPKALFYANKLKLRKPDDKEVLYHLLSIYLELKEKDKSIKTLDKILHYYPNDKKAQLLKADIK